MFVNLSLELQQHIGPWLFRIISFEGIYISVHKFDIIYLPETYLDLTVPLDDDNLVISGYNLIRPDHPSNTKRGGVCLYYKNYLPPRVLIISYLKECRNFELKIRDKSCNFIVLYRSPSQSQDDFKAFSDKEKNTRILNATIE